MVVSKILKNLGVYFVEDKPKLLHEKKIDLIKLFKFKFDFNDIYMCTLTLHKHIKLKMR